VSGSDDNADARLRFLAFDLNINLSVQVFPKLCVSGLIQSRIHWKNTTRERGREMWSVSHADALQRTITVVSKRSSMNV
jgi:hypothetical protein